MTGEEHAELILSARKDDSDQREWQLRKREILKDGIPVFWSALCKLLKSKTDGFNSKLGITGDSGLQFYPCDSYVTLTKTQLPKFLGKVSLIPGTRVRITIETVRGMRQPEVNTEDYLFDVRSDGTIEVNGKDFHTLADELFSAAAVFFR